MNYQQILSLNSVPYFWPSNKLSMMFLRWLHRFYAVILFVVAFLVVFPLLFLFAQKEKWHKYAYKITHRWVLLYYPMIGINIEIEDRNLNKWRKPCIYVANHFSFTDIASFPIIANDACFVGKQSITKAPLFGYFFSSLHITVDRESIRDRAKVFAKSESAIKNGKSLFMFPEGGILTTNPPYQTRYKDGAFRMAINTGVPIVPVTFPSNWRLMPDDGKMLFRSNYLKIVIHEAIETTNLTETDIPELRNMAYEVIQEELLVSNEKYLSQDKMKAQL